MIKNPDDPTADEAEPAESDVQQGSTDPAQDDGQAALEAMPDGNADTGDQVTERQPASHTNEEDQTGD
jgi:hypothetical protein